MSDIEQKYYKQKNLINFLKRDNQEMNQKLRILTKQNELYKDELTEYETDISECDKILNDIKSQIKQKDSQIKALRREANETQIGKNEKKMRLELEKVSENKVTLQKTLKDRQEEVLQLEEKYHTLQMEYENQIQQDRKKREELEKQLSKLNNAKVNKMI